MICSVESCNDKVRTVLRNGNKVPIKYCDEHFREKMRYAGRSTRREERYIDKDGYVLIWHDNQRIGEHRVIMQQKLGRKLLKNESVHHINGIRDDNHPDNLELWVGGIRYGQRASDVICPHCGEPYHIDKGAK